MNDLSSKIVDQVKQAHNDRIPVYIKAGNTKSFLGNPVKGEILDISGHRGVTSYEPSELIITAHAGTTIADIEKTLTKNNQMLAFEPANLSGKSTIGGSIASGLSGPRRPYAGAARDFVLGMKVINGRGEHMEFGGQVMKNVAGYDVSRLMCGAMGTLGVITDVSLKVLPMPALEITLSHDCDVTEFLNIVIGLSGKPLPISAACHYDNTMYLRLSGSEQSVLSAKDKLIGEDMSNDDAGALWSSLQNYKHPQFTTSTPLWRLSLPATTIPLQIEGNTLVDWGGAQRWVSTDEDPDLIRSLCDTHNGHATLFMNNPGDIEAYHPLSGGIYSIHKSLKMAFDPDNILNPGRLYKEL